MKEKYNILINLAEKCDPFSILNVIATNDKKNRLSPITRLVYGF